MTEPRREWSILNKLTLQCAKILRLEESMPALKNDKFREYTRHAEYCLNMVVSTRDQELRCAQREMAAEWLRLADVARRPRKFKQMQMG